MVAVARGEGNGANPGLPFGAIRVPSRLLLSMSMECDDMPRRCTCGRSTPCTWPPPNAPVPAG
jgi:hypothetical protein